MTAPAPAPASTAPAKVLPLTLEITLPAGQFFKSLTSFKWADIPPFAVITGRNGVGKTQLLELLGYRLTNTRHPSGQVTDAIKVSVSDPTIDAGSVAFLANTWTIDSNGAMSIAEMRQRKNELYEQLRPHNVEHDMRRRSMSWRIAKHLKVDSISQMSQEEFVKKLPDDFSFMLDDTEVSQGLVFVFNAYRLRFVQELEKGTPRADILKALGPAPWEVLNEVLKVADFPYEVMSPVGSSLLDTYEIALIEKGKKTRLSPSDLSSGEKMLFRVVTWLYSSERHNRFPRLMLLDEPDAHLHPSMTRVFLQVLQEVLVAKYGVRIILSTHSPSTVALAPEGSIFEMSKTAPRIQPCKRADAIGLLTAGLVTVAPGSRFVFVEDRDDVDFYSAVRDILSDYGPSKDPMAIAPAPSIAFLPVSVGKGTSKISGGSTVVKGWVDKLDQPPLLEIFRGVIDRDSGNVGTSRVYVLGRYSFENYLLDPFVVFGLLLGNGHQPAVPSVALMVGEEHRIRTLSIPQLQAIVDAIALAVEPLLISPDKTPMPVTFTNGVAVNYPKWMLDTRGHDLLPVYQKAFGGPGTISPPKLIHSLFRVRLMPIELVDILRKIQA